jgi:hypothetical protein
MKTATPAAEFGLVFFPWAVGFDPEALESGMPHCPQKRFWGEFCCWQAGQRT